MRREVIATYGQPRRRDRVRVVRSVVRGEPVVRAEWKIGDARKSTDFPDTRKGIADAKDFAKKESDRLAAKVSVLTFEPLTVRQLFEKHINAKCDAWRPRTLQVKKERWQLFELRVGKNTPAHLITRETLDDFKRAMLSSKRAVNQVKLYIENAQAVFRWGVDRDLIPPTKVVSYRAEFSKDAKRQTVQMAEYSADERSRILAKLDPRKANEWRAWALVTLFGACGPRQFAARHLEWQDITLDGLTGEIHWRPELDKMGSDRIQPMPAPVAEAFWVALGWRMHDKYTGRFVFYGARQKTKSTDRPFTYQAFAYALHEAEKKADVKAIKYRAAHGFRRGIAGDIHDETGSEKMAADWIGDKNPRVVREHYLLNRNEQMERIASLVGENLRTNANKKESAAISDDAKEVSHA